MEEERRRRDEEERSRGVRIELPQIVDPGSEQALPRQGGVTIVDISPRDDSVIDL